jgi:hypothetical protein
MAWSVLTPHSTRKRGVGLCFLQPQKSNPSQLRPFRRGCADGVAAVRGNFLPIGAPIANQSPQNKAKNFAKSALCQMPDAGNQPGRDI